ncbi:hypothetical protein [Lacticaseibacillus hulanensis]|uniref:hypothetical protein n=1 Tax=Lacticaseibacillus hulanensis TaxID=2493111 RepID=UPI000FDC404F|nr:hypothetical protein [Lacticaseibacillus hulanensis]
MKSVWKCSAVLALCIGLFWFIGKASTPTSLKGSWQDTEGVYWVFKGWGHGRVYAGHSDDEMVHHGYYDNGDIYDYADDDSSRDDNTINFTYHLANGQLKIEFDDDVPMYGEWGDDDELSGTSFTGELAEEGKVIYGGATGVPDVSIYKDN